MISPDYALMMAQYNALQNKGVSAVVQAMSMADLTQDRGAFFGSVFATLNHLLWADRTWLSRFSSRFDAPDTGAQHTEFTPTIMAWAAERERTDMVIIDWAKSLEPTDLEGDLAWTSVMTGRSDSASKALCVTAFFNHQTHHRGQVHAMLTAAGQQLPATDLNNMPRRD